MDYTESGLKFSFPDENWWVTQFDKETDYKKVDDHLKGTKSIDFLGIYNQKTLYLFEIKSFRGYSHDESVRDRCANHAEDLMNEIALKVRDTLACLIGGARNSTHKSSDWKKVCKMIVDVNKEIRIIAWVEEDWSNSLKKERGKSELGIRTQKLKKKLSWLSTKVSIQNLNEHTKVNNLRVMAI